MHLALAVIPTPQLIAELKAHEGFRRKPYLCTRGFCTIGYGLNLEAHPQYIPDEHIRERVRARELGGRMLQKALGALALNWTEKEACAALHAQCVNVRNALSAKCPPFVRLCEAGEVARAEVLVNMAFNMGVGGLLKFGDTLAMLDAALAGSVGFERAAQCMLRSVWASQVGVRARVLAARMREGRWGATL